MMETKETMCTSAPTLRRRCSAKCIGGYAIAVLSLVLGCEFLIYYFVLAQCSWPARPTVPTSEGTEVKAMIVADTHLLGPFRGNWFDKLRREWQMKRAFQAAVTIFNPEVIFFLGDLFDEGMWVSEADFEDYVTRFRSLFKVRDDVRTYVVPGNHDMGFHYAIVPPLKSRFNKAFNTTSVKLVKIKESIFILVNSMALHQDGCFLCHSAEVRIRKLADKLRCLKDPNWSKTRCEGENKPKPNVSYSRPIILQHFPLYRKSDSICTGPDAAPLAEKTKEFKQKWDCLSKDSTDKLLNYFEPRLILSGHTHHGCLVHHELAKAKQVPEYSVPSFSWRNRFNPSFMLGIFTKDKFYISKCFLPEEKTIIVTYILGFVSVFVSILVKYKMQRSFKLEKYRSEKQSLNL